MATQTEIKTVTRGARSVPNSMLKAAGILKRHKKALEAHIKKFVKNGRESDT